MVETERDELVESPRFVFCLHYSAKMPESNVGNERFCKPLICSHLYVS